MPRTRGFTTPLDSQCPMSRLTRSASVRQANSDVNSNQIVRRTRSVLKKSLMSNAKTSNHLSSPSNMPGYSLRKRRVSSASSSVTSEGTLSPASSIQTHKENLKGVIAPTRVLRSTREIPFAPNYQINESINEESDSQFSTPAPKRRKTSLISHKSEDIKPITPSGVFPEFSPLARKSSKQNDSDCDSHICSSSFDDSSNLFISPGRKSRTAGKEHDAKLKRLTARKIEIDSELLELSSQSFSESQNSSILNMSLTDPKQRLLELCGQHDIKDWSDLFDQAFYDHVVKIGEGVYGEVFQSQKGNVIKIFPIEGTQLVNGEKQMTFDEVFPEVFISKKLTELAYKHRNDRAINFVQLRRSTIVSGEFPIAFNVAWKIFASEKGSDNENLCFLPADQLWMVLEFDFAGETLDKFRFNNCREARSVIVQLALSLAAAESAFQFEHRDLHWLNVLVKPSKQTKLRYRVGGISFSVMTQGVHVSIIDFTVSRLCYEGNTVYVDMSDSPEIFEGEGDYQFEIYRMMKNRNKNNWRPFIPETNLYWLHYLMDKLLTETSYPRRDPDQQAVESEMRALYDCILNSGYKGAMDLVHNNFYFDACRIDSVSSDND